MNYQYLLQNSLNYTNSISLQSTLKPQLELNYETKIGTKIDTRIVDITVSFSKETSIPLSIIKNNSSLEAIVLYLKDVSKMRYSQIAQLLNRDQRTIWVTYANAKKKAMHLELGDDIQLSIPASIFTSRNFSILESIVFYLKIDHALTFNQISELLGKNYRTIWTVYRRALAKFSNEQR